MLPSSSATVLPPSASVVPLPPSLSRTISRGRQLVSGEEESRARGEDMELNGEGEHRRERLDRELDGVQGMLGDEDMWFLGMSRVNASRMGLVRSLCSLTKFLEFPLQHALPQFLEII